MAQSEHPVRALGMFASKSMSSTAASASGMSSVDQQLKTVEAFVKVVRPRSRSIQFTPCLLPLFQDDDAHIQNSMCSYKRTHSRILCITRTDPGGSQGGRKRANNASNPSHAQYTGGEADSSSQKHIRSTSTATSNPTRSNLHVIRRGKSIWYM